jgi:hypothetical protein
MSKRACNHAVYDVKGTYKNKNEQQRPAEADEESDQKGAR